MADAAPEVEVEEKEGTLDERMTETIRGKLAELTKDAPAEEAQEVEQVEAKPAAKPEKAVEGERARGPDGKFIAKEPAAPAKAEKAQTPIEAAAPAQAAAATPEETERPLTLTTGQPIDISRAPSSWKPAAKAIWGQLPEAVRQEVYRRESDYLNGNKPLKENADFGQAIRQTVEPYRGIIEAGGGTLERAIADTMKTAVLFRTGSPQEKMNALFSIDATFNGGALNALFQQRVAQAVAQATGQPAPQGQQQPQPQNFQDPRVDQVLALFQKQENERNAEIQRASASATEQFISAKDDKGSPKYPFVDNVIDDMSARVAAIRQANPGLGHKEVLEQAYEQAVWANPETRAVLMSQQQAQATQQTEQLQKVEKAKRASAGVMPKRGSIPATAPKAKWGSPEADEEIRATYRELTG